MREFVVVAESVPADGGLSLDDLPGAGRVDVVCRCVAAAFCLSHAIREDVRMVVVVDAGVAVWFEGRELRYLAPDERSAAGLLRSAFGRTDEAVGAQRVESSPGVRVGRGGLEGALDAVEGSVYQLHEDGVPLPEAGIGEGSVFVVAGHEGFSPEAAGVVEAAAAGRVRVGPVSLHADQAITVVHNYLDTDEHTAY